MALYTIKKREDGLSKQWIMIQGEPLDGFIGNRDAETFRRLYDKVKHVQDCTFYTDNWEVVFCLKSVMLLERSIQSLNSNTRHHLARMTRRTKVVSRSEDMV